MADNPIIHVIDDDDAARDGLVFLLTTSDFQPRDYDSAKSFLDVVLDVPPGCVITDLSMPEISGLDLLRELKAIGIDWPVIVVTGQGEVAVAVEALKAGAADFIEKPYDADVLLGAVATVSAPHGTARAARKAEIDQRLVTLSAEERLVLDRLVDGQSTISIAQELQLDSRVIEVRRANLMTKMHATRFSDLIRMALLAERLEED
jgi:two-component system response regulator FixJ